MIRRYELEYTWDELKNLAALKGKNLQYVEDTDNYYVFFSDTNYIYSTDIDRLIINNTDLIDFETNYKALCNVESENSIIQYKNLGVDLSADDVIIDVPINFDIKRAVFYITLSKKLKHKLIIYYKVDEVEISLYETKKEEFDAIRLGEDSDENFIFKRGDSFKIFIEKQNNTTMNLIINMERA